MSGIDRVTESGVRSIDLFATVVWRRRELATREYEAGRISYAMALAADAIAEQPEMPVDEGPWCRLLAALDEAMTTAAIGACGPVSYQTGTPA